MLVRDSDERPSVPHAEAASGSVDGRDTRHYVGPSAAGPSLDRLGRGPARQTTRSRGRGCRRPSTRHSRETPGAATDHVRGPGGEDSDGGACERPAPATSCPLHAPATTASAHGQRRGPTRAHGPGGRAPLFFHPFFRRPTRTDQDAWAGMPRSSSLSSLFPSGARAQGTRTPTNVHATSPCASSHREIPTSGRPISRLLLCSFRVFGIMSCPSFHQQQLRVRAVFGISNSGLLIAGKF